MPQLKFREDLENRFHVVITKFVSRELVPEVIRDLRNELQERARATMSDHSIELSDAAHSWLVDRYFKEISVGDGQIMSDMVIINEYEPSDFTDDDVRTLLREYDNTRLYDDILGESRRRVS